MWKHGLDPPGGRLTAVKIPPILQQLPGRELNLPLRSPRAYNPGIVSHLGKTTIAWRMHLNAQTGRCGIGMGILNDDGSISDAGIVEFERDEERSHYEDPRLIVHKGRILMSYTRAVYSAYHWISSQRYGFVERDAGKWRVVQWWQPKYGAQFKVPPGKEKNWMFFSRGDELWAVYSISPHVVIQVSEDQVLREVRSEPTVNWWWGRMSGSTPPVIDGQSLTSFFHAYLPDWRRVRRYNFGAYSFNPDPPFEIRSMSHQPMAWASEEDGWAIDPRNAKQWQPLCLFPGGATLNGNGWRLVVGVNDFRSVELRLPRPSLGPPVTSDPPYRVYRAVNPNMPIKARQGFSLEVVAWKDGIIRTKDPRIWLAAELADAQMIYDDITP